MAAGERQKLWARAAGEEEEEKGGEEKREIKAGGHLCQVLPNLEARREIT